MHIRARQSGYHRWLLAIGLACFCLTAAADRPGIVIRSAHTELVDGVYQLDARYDATLSDSAREALENGVPLVINAAIEVRRVRRYLWKETVASLSQRYRLHYHALSRRYLVVNLNSGVQESAPTLADALRLLGHLERIPVIDRRLLEKGQKYTVRLRIDLDLDALPMPLRTLAYLSPSWYLSSDWYELPL